MSITSREKSQKVFLLHWSRTTYLAALISSMDTQFNLFIFSFIPSGMLKVYSASQWILICNSRYTWKLLLRWVVVAMKGLLSFAWTNVSFTCRIIWSMCRSSHKIVILHKNYVLCDLPVIMALCYYFLDSHTSAAFLPSSFYFSGVLQKHFAKTLCRTKVFPQR